MAVMTPRYDAVFVILSVIVAMLASFAALDLAGRVRSRSGATRLGWLTGGGTVMGLGIWSMHFVGMLAFHLPVPIGYDVPRMLLSVVVAIAASLLALMVISRPTLRLLTLVPGGILMGGAIAGMHAAEFAPSQPLHRSMNLMVASGELGRVIFVCAILIIVLSLIGAVIDRTMQARSAATDQLAEQTIQLGKSERQYRLLVDHNPNPMWVSERETRAFLAVNEAPVAHYGYSREEFLSMTLNTIRIWPGGTTGMKCWWRAAVEKRLPSHPRRRHS